MYLASLSVEGFRSLEKLELRFCKGLNVLVGPNNAGKSAVVDALRLLLCTGDEGALRITDYDMHLSGLKKSTQVTFKYIFRGLDETEEADFLNALKPVGKAGAALEYEAHLSVRYSNPDVSGRLRVKRWCGDHEENSISPEMLEDLRAVYLPPLRDPAQGLRPSRSSQLSRLIQRLSDETSRKDVTDALAKFDDELKGKKPIADTQAAIIKRHVDCSGQVISDTAIGLFAAMFRSKTAGGRLPNTAFSRSLL